MNHLVQKWQKYTSGLEEYTARKVAQACENLERQNIKDDYLAYESLLDLTREIILKYESLEVATNSTFIDGRGQSRYAVTFFCIIGPTFTLEQLRKNISDVADSVVAFIEKEKAWRKRTLPSVDYVLYLYHFQCCPLASPTDEQKYTLMCRGYR